MSYTVELKRGVGYIGKHGLPAWVAMVGPEWPKKRKFLDADFARRNKWNRSKYTLTLEFSLEDGVYEIAQAGERWGLVVRGDRARQVSWDTLRELASMLGSGSTIDDIWRATRPPKPPAQEAQAQPQSQEAPAQEAQAQTPAQEAQPNEASV